MRGLIQRIAWIVVLALGAGLLLAGAASAGAPQAKTKKKAKQQQTQQPDQTDQQQQTDQAQPSDQPPPPPPPTAKPLLTQKVTLRSSHQTRDTATAGFNGVGPDGKIKDALLNANPSADAKAKAAQLSLVEADASDLQAFAKEGQLTLPAKSAEKKGK